MSKEDAEFWRGLRAKLLAGTASIFERPPRTDECTRAAPNRRARYHQGTRIGTVTHQDGEYIRYKCDFCGREWETQ